MAGIDEIRHRQLTELSGGQRQLAWIAMALAQSPRYLLLDEPTTFLDLAHQFDVMDLVRRLNRELGKTIVLVVHDLNLAARYADHLFAVRSGKIVASGKPAEVLTVATLRSVFDVETRIVRDEAHGTLFCIPVERAVTQEHGPETE
jgi:iron complex transport system ATP-binding protein